MLTRISKTDMQSATTYHRRQNIEEVQPGGSCFSRQKEAVAGYIVGEVLLSQKNSSKTSRRILDIEGGLKEETLFYAKPWRFTGEVELRSFFGWR